MQVWINGELIAEEKAKISLFDRSYLYGEGIFETMRSYAGRPAFLDRHYARLQKNCERLGIPLTIQLPALREAITELLKVNHLSDAAVRLTISSTGASFGVGRPAAMPVTLTLFARPIELDPKLFDTGVVVYPHPTMVNDIPLLTQIKSTSYLNKMVARKEASQHNAFDTLLKNANGFWCEGSRTNFFIVHNGVVVTPPLNDHLLGGVTRAVVLEILKEKKIAHREDHVTDAMLRESKEVFLTGSTGEVMPVQEVIGFGKKQVNSDSVAKALLICYRDRIKTSR